MRQKLLGSVILAGTILFGSLLGTGTANATPSQAVCDGIDKASTYLSYLEQADVMGRLVGYSPSQQAQNIVGSVLVYCPWHADGIRAAAAVLADD